MEKIELIISLAKSHGKQAISANRLWIVLLILSVWSLGVKPNRQLLIELPFNLGSFEEKDFHTLSVIVLCIISIAFLSSISQAIRTRRLIQFSIDETEGDEIFVHKVHSHELADSLMHPMFTRISPIIQYTQLEEPFHRLGRPSPIDKHSKLRRAVTIVFYVILKLTTICFVYFIPILAITRSWGEIKDSYEGGFGTPLWLVQSLVVV